ncbi:MAG: hypothetical protein FWF82_01135 [Oscillospiraceae bacterium]|nr:hypothetical protein [Oscillospiraceae bacterium]
MANSAEIIQLNTVESTCQKILLAIEEKDCKTVEDVKGYIADILSDVDMLKRKKDIL